MGFVIMIQRPTPIKIPQSINSICIILRSSWQHFICDGEKLAGFWQKQFDFLIMTVILKLQICFILYVSKKCKICLFVLQNIIARMCLFSLLCLEICQHIYIYIYMQCDNLQNTIRYPLSIPKRSKVKKACNCN